MFLSVKKRRTPSRAARRLTALLAAPLLVSAYNTAPPARAQETGAAQTLEAGRPVERVLTGGQAHSYTLTLGAGRYVHIVVEQKGVDVVLSWFAPDGRKLDEVDSPNGDRGEEVLEAITETAGSYRLELRANEPTAPAGRYEAKLAESREATPRDGKYFAAKRAEKAADKLFDERTAESLRQAVVSFEEALGLYRELGERAGEAKTLNAIGFIERRLGRTQEALARFKEALAAFRSLGDREGQVMVLSSLGDLYQHTGESQHALEHYDRALALAREMGERGLEGRVLFYISHLYISLSEYRKSLGVLEEALSLSKSMKDRQAEANVYNDLGDTYRGLGEPQQALDNHNRALDISREIGDRGLEEVMFNNLGYDYMALSDYPQALLFFTRAREQARALNNRPHEAQILLNIGSLYNFTDDYRNALTSYDEALAITRSLGDRRLEALILGNTGTIYGHTGEYRKALDSYGRALALLEASGDKAAQPAILLSTGRLYLKTGEPQRALESYERALSISRQAGDRETEPLALSGIGSVYETLGETRKAADYLERALAIHRDFGDREHEADVLYALASSELKRGDASAALPRIEAAVGIVESLRAKLASHDLRTSYFASVHDYYTLYADVLMRLHGQRPAEGFDAKALRVSEQARARSLLEMLAEAGADIRQGIDPALLVRERSLRSQLDAKARARFGLKQSGGARGEARAKELSGEIDALVADYVHVESEIRARSPRYAALTQPQPVSLREIQSELLDRDTVLLEYALGEDRSYLWAVTNDSLKSFELPKRADVEETARRVYELVTARRARAGESGAERSARVARAEAEFPAAAAALSRMVLAPAAAQLGHARIVVVGDGALLSVPFAALPTPANAGGERPPLAVEHEVVSLPSASIISTLRRELRGRRPAPKAVAVLADPVFAADDERVRTRVQPPTARPDSTATAASRSSSFDIGRALADLGEDGGDDERLGRLLNSREEAAAIISLAPASSMRALDFAASRATAVGTELGRYRILHFATHSLVDNAHPELSGIVLSLVDEQGRPQDGFLRAHEIFNLKLPAELVVLSACRTGLGKRVRGEGLIGLTRGFMYAGTPRVIVSLWSVEDRATAELMARLYRKMLGRERLSPAAALRSAQVEMWRSRRWHSPYYWAAFVLQGEWGHEAAPLAPARRPALRGRND